MSGWRTRSLILSTILLILSTTLIVLFRLYQDSDMKNVIRISFFTILLSYYGFANLDVNGNMKMIKYCYYSDYDFHYLLVYI
jgi:hypothetical protein